MRFFRIAAALLAWTVAGPTVFAQGVTEEVVGGGVLTEEDLAAAEAPPEPQADQDEEDEAGDRPPLVVELAPPRDFDGPASPAPTTYALDNGLTVVLQPTPGHRFTAVAMTYRVGSTDVPDGWSGLAHLTEHLMFSGTDRLDEVEVYLRLEAAGAVERNGETGPDRTIYYALLPTAQLPNALWLESQRMARTLAGLNEQRVRRQRQVVLHEGYERGAYGWRGLLAEHLYTGTLGDAHPYRAIVERPEDVAAARLRHVQWFFQRHYAPDRATLVLVGGFDPDAVRPLIERLFAPIVRSAPAIDEPVREPVAPMGRGRRIEIDIQHDRDQLYVAWPTPALYADGDAELDVLSTLLIDRRDAPIRQALLESGLALDVEVRQRSHELASVFAIHAVPAPGHTVEELRAAIDGVLDRVRRAPFDDAAVEQARGRWARRMRLGVEDLAARAVRLGTGTDGYVPSLEAERQRYASVDAEAVAETVRRWLPANRRLVLVGVADPDAPSEGRVRRDEVRE